MRGPSISKYHRLTAALLSLLAVVGSPAMAEEPSLSQIRLDPTAAPAKLVAVYLVADANTKARELIPLRIPGKDETTIEVEAEPLLKLLHFNCLEVEPVFPDKHTVSVSLTPAGVERYSQVAEEHLGREYVWVIDGVARTKSVLRYPGPGGGYGVDIDDDAAASEKLQARLQEALAERQIEKRAALAANEWDGAAKNLAAGAYLAWLLEAHQSDDGWLHAGVLSYCTKKSSSA